MIWEGQAELAQPEGDYEHTGGVDNWQPKELGGGG